MSRRHLSQSVSGALANWNKKTWAAVGKDNDMTGEEVRARFLVMQMDGIELIPIGDCKGHSSTTGCPGHVDVCPECGSAVINVARDIVGTHRCGNGHEWVPKRGD